jgi:hypothetical protein
MVMEETVDVIVDVVVMAEIVIVGHYEEGLAVGRIVLLSMKGSFRRFMVRRRRSG